MNGIKMLCRKYKDIILYGIFGVTTTLVNVAVYWFVAHPIGLSTLPSTIIAWIMAVFFAYITNRKWVFHSEAHTRDEIMKEVVSFFSCRIATGAVDWLCMWLFVDILLLNDIVVKAIANVVVIILNYIASKLVIFKQKKN